MFPSRTERIFSMLVCLTELVVIHENGIFNIHNELQTMGTQILNATSDDATTSKIEFTCRQL